jgi:5-formyltetrahydrofolate cyclo-ligase
LTKIADNSKIIAYKKKARKEILSKLRSQSRTDILKKSSIIKERLFGLEEFRKARCVIAYVSMAEEVDTHQIIDESIRMGKMVGVPVLVKGERDLIISQITDRIRQLEIGPYGINQPKKDEIKPISPESMDLILVPALVYDKGGNRLGRGKGYYDRFLEKVPEHALTVGLCFDFQIAESVPTVPHDIPVRTLLTDA